MEEAFVRQIFYSCLLVSVFSVPVFLYCSRFYPIRYRYVCVHVRFVVSVVGAVSVLVGVIVVAVAIVVVIVVVVVVVVSVGVAAAAVVVVVVFVVVLLAVVAIMGRGC